MNNLKMKAIMKTTNTIKNFAMRFVAIMAVVLLAGNAWGEQASITFSSLYNSNTVIGEDAIEIVEGITVSFTDGGTATQYYTNGTSIRWYGGGTMTISSTIGNITAVTITYTRTDNDISADAGTWNSPNWSCNNDDITSVTFTEAGTSGHLRISTISVTYTPLPSGYAVTYDAGEHGTAPSGATASSVELAAITGVTGYTCTGWVANKAVKEGNTSKAAGTALSNGTTYTILEATTFTAQWRANTYKVDFDANGGSGSMSKQDFEYGTAQNLSANGFTAPTHKYFYGWHRTESEADAGNREYTNEQSVSNLSSTDNSTVKLYAVWKDHTYKNYRTVCNDKYTVTYEAPDATSGEVPTDATEYSKNDEVTVLGGGTLAKTNYSFAGWTDGANNYAAGAKFNITDFVTLSAVWECAKAVEVSKATTTTNGSFTLDKSGELATCEGNVVVTVTPSANTGYEFSAITVDGVGTKDDNAKTVTYTQFSEGESEINVIFAPKTYTITLDREGATNGSESVTMTYNSATHTAITAPTKDGNTFGGWWSEDNGNGSMVMDADGTLQANVTNYTDKDGKWIKDATCTLYAKWTLKDATITLNNYTGTATTTGYKYGDQFTLPEDNDACNGKSFVGWSSVEINNSVNKPTAATYHEPNTVVTLGETNTFYAVFAEDGGEDYVLVTSTSTALAAGDHIIIANAKEAGEATKAIGKQNDNNRTAVSITIAEGGVIENPTLATSTSNTTDIYPFVLEANNGAFAIKEDFTGGRYLTAPGSGSSGNNYMRTADEANATTAKWNISIAPETAVASVRGNNTATNARNTMQNNGNLFSCYASANQSPVYIYRRPSSTNYTTVCEDCEEVTLSFEAVEHGTMVVKRGGKTLSNGNTITTCDEESITVKVTPDAANHYRITAMSISGVDGISINPATTAGLPSTEEIIYTVTIPEDATGTLTITPTIEAIPTKTVVFVTNGDNSGVSSQTVYVGEAPQMPAALAVGKSFEESYTTFAGWTKTAWEGIKVRSAKDALTGDQKVFLPNENGIVITDEDAETITYHAVWANGTPTTSYEKLANNSFSTTDKYVISEGTHYFNTCYNTDENNSWGYCTTAPAEYAPIEFTLSGTASALVARTIESTPRYLKSLATNDFQMSSTSTTVALSANGEILNSSNNSYILKYNNTGLRWYSSSAGQKVYFYRVVISDDVYYLTTSHNITGATKAGTALTPATLKSTDEHAYAGKSITLTAELNVGYELNSWAVTTGADAVDGTEDTDASGNPTFTFDMPAGDVVVSVNTSINTNVEVGENEEFVIDEPAALNNLVVEDGGTVTVNAETTLNNLIVEAGGQVSGSSALTVNNLTINSEAGKSGQVMNATNVTVNGDIYLEIKLCEGAMDAEASRKWYCISAPFNVNMNGGFLWGDGTPMVLNTDFQLFEWDGDRRATGISGWKRVSGVMKAGIAYFIGFDDDRSNQNIIKLKATNKTISNKSSISAPEHSSSVDVKYANWNGLANPNFHYIALDKDVQAFDHSAQGYNPYESGEYNFVVGTPFFIKETGDITIEAADNGAFRAPKREVEQLSYCVRIAREGKAGFDNQMYVRASEEASASYEEGHDLVTMNAETSNYGALLWTVNYGGKRLAIEEAPLVNDKASYALSLYAPADGAYRIETPTVRMNADLYLTYEGAIIWDLSMGAYEAELVKGNNEGYGLLLQAKMPMTPTGVEQSEVSHQPSDIQKIIIDDNVFILRGGKMYDVTGKAVK